MNFTFFSSVHGTFSRIDHILGHKSNLDKFKKIKIIPSIISDHNASRLDLNYRRKTIKNSNIWRLNSTLLNNQQITEEIKKEIKICIETSRWLDKLKLYSCDKFLRQQWTLSLTTQVELVRKPPVMSLHNLDYSYSRNRHK